MGESEREGLASTVLSIYRAMPSVTASSHSHSHSYSHSLWPFLVALGHSLPLRSARARASPSREGGNVRACVRVGTMDDG